MNCQEIIIFDDTTIYKYFLDRDNESDERPPPKKKRKSRDSETDGVSVSSCEGSGTDIDGNDTLCTINTKESVTECQKLLQKFRSKGFEEQDCVAKTEERIQPRL